MNKHRTETRQQWDERQNEAERQRVESQRTAEAANDPTPEPDEPTVRLTDAGLSAFRARYGGPCVDCGVVRDYHRFMQGNPGAHLFRPS